ncbi:MAG: hypothetical protein ABIG68_02705 [Acidobacteriota bacterium]
MSSLASTLKNIVLPSAVGDPVRLGALWEAGPAALVFLRHYG